MYPPPHHQSRDIQKMISLIKEFPLGMLISVLDNNPVITHIPLIYNEQSGKLIAHIDKQNPQVESLKNGAEVTVVFRGPDTYISPSIYTTNQLPTWNYIMVHIKGTVTLINDPDAAKDTMIDMTKFLEGKEQKYVLKKDNDAMDRFVNYIQAFEIDVTNWEGKFKLSQDKCKEDQMRAKDQLVTKSGRSREAFISEMYLGQV
tara:strand:+ start:1450 stop:2055 length:606 start_codon:yes stop_codon:yes gene_type:complete